MHSRAKENESRIVPNGSFGHSNSSAYVFQSRRIFMEMATERFRSISRRANISSIKITKPKTYDSGNLRRKFLRHYNNCGSHSYYFVRTFHEFFDPASQSSFYLLDHVQRSFRYRWSVSGVMGWILYPFFHLLQSLRPREIFYGALSRACKRQSVILISAFKADWCQKCAGG